MKIIILFVLIYYAIAQITTNQFNIFEILKAKNLTCDLHAFIIRSNATVNNDYQMFIDDLTKYCFNSSSVQFSKLLCHMITIELETACRVFNQSRSISIIYNSQYTSKQICSQKSVILTNNWIWEKLSTAEKESIGSSSISLCSVVTTNEETLRLVRFFYRLASRIRRSNSINSVNQTVDQKNILTNNNTIILKKDLLVQPTANKSELNEPAREPMLEGFEPAKKNEIIQKDATTTKQITNETKQRDEGLPLGRAGEKPEREQVNERPKPKPLDANVVFQRNAEDGQNWVQGKNIDNKIQDPLIKNPNKLSNIQIDENPVVMPQAAKKRPLSRFKFSRHLDDSDDNGDLSQSLVTTILVVILCFVLLYLILHNKNKILGLIIEGCKRQRRANNHHVRLSQSTH